MDKQFLITQLENGMSTRKIAALPNVNIARSAVSYWINKYGLNDKMKYKKPLYNDSYFSIIDSKEKAYILGYTLADGYINNSSLEYGCALSDKELLYFIAEQLNISVRIDTYLNKACRRFPRARISIGNKHIVSDINRLCNSKENKTFPRIRQDLQSYMLLGFFDGDGCITWGHRKDRNRIWQKVNFTGSYKLLLAIQKYLEKNNITSSLRPKGLENCYVLEISSKESVLNTLKLMYGKEDLIVLKRKFDKYNALRLELGENEENTHMSTISCQAVSHETEGVETTGEKMVSLNNQQECPSL